MIVAERYESLRNGSIGTVVSSTENEVVLDFEGTQKTIKMSNLKRWYKPCGMAKEDVKQANEQAKKVEQLNKRVSDPSKPNGDLPKKEDCSAVANKIISYLEKKGCLTKKTCSYTRVRLEGFKRNIMEVWWGKRLVGVKVVVREEALRPYEDLHKLGTTFPPSHAYVLNHVYKFNNSSDMQQVYSIIDAVVEFERTAKPIKTGKKPGTKNKPKVQE